ncbi:MAG: hypothetical protein KF791_00375 [Verrucomicrobiae bacterium]|nr:hypothetical protein [Verrucomicrobiae bacterium]
MKLLLTLLFATEILLADTAATQTPIYYTRYTDSPAGPVAQLFRLGVGTDTQIPVGLPEQALPAISKSGRFAAVTSGDPNRPNKISQNVYIIDLADNSPRLLVEKSDATDPITGSSTTTLPLFKAFSPDGSLLAVSSVRQTIANPQGLSTSPLLEIHRVTDGFPVALTVIGQIRTGDYTEMAGLDWSGQGNVLVTPLRRDSPTGPGQVTAIHLVSPIEDAIGRNAFTQISFPQSTSGFNQGVFFTLWENDLLPAFAPNGTEVAYFRAPQGLAGTVPPQRFFQQPVLLVRNLNSHQTRTVRNFPQGLYPTGLSWSPDGTRLIVGIAPLLFSDGQPIPQGNLLQSNLVIVNAADGTSEGVGIPASAAFPAWPPVDGSSSGSLPAVTLSPGTNGNLILQTHGAVPSANFTLKSSGNLSTWGNPQTFTGAELNNGFTVTPGQIREFFRIEASTN